MRSYLLAKKQYIKVGVVREEWKLSALRDIWGSSARDTKFLHLGKNGLMCLYAVRHSAGKHHSRKDPGEPSLQSWTWAGNNCLMQRSKKNILGCCAASSLRQVILPLCSVLVRSHMQYCFQCWAPQHKRGIDITEKIQQRTVIMIKDLGHLFYEERVRGSSISHPSLVYKAAERIRPASQLFCI